MRRTEFREHRLQADIEAPGWFAEDGQHALYLVEGSLRLEFEGYREILLTEGDAAFYDGRAPHRWHIGAPARVVVAVVRTPGP